MCGGCGSRGVRTDRDDSCMRVQLNVCVRTVTVTTNSFEKYGCTWGSRRVSSRSRLGDAYRIAARRAARRLTHVSQARANRTNTSTHTGEYSTRTYSMPLRHRTQACNGWRSARADQRAPQASHHSIRGYRMPWRPHRSTLTLPSILLPSGTFARRQHAPRFLSWRSRSILDAEALVEKLRHCGLPLLALCPRRLARCSQRCWRCGAS